MCVAGKYSSPLSQKPSNRNQDQQQYIISNNRETFNTNNNGDSKCSNGIHSTSNLNNKSDFNCVTNKIYHHHINGNSLCNNNQNSIAKSVILGYDKNTLDYKNNKNMILNRHKNKADINGNNTLTNNNYNQSNAYASQQIYEKHLNSINHLKSGLHAKHFIIANEIEHFDTKKNVKFQLAKPQNGVDSVEHLNNIGNGNVTKDKAPNVLEIIPTNVNIHKVNGHLNGFYMSGHNNMKNGTEPTAAQNLKSAESHSKPHEKTRNGFVRNCSHNGRSNECSTIKINYVSRQIRGGYVNTNAQATNENHSQDNSLHEKPKRATNTPSVPNIVINGTSTDLCDIRPDGTDDEEESSTGKLWPNLFPIALFMFRNSSDFEIAFMFYSFYFHHDNKTLFLFQLAEGKSLKSFRKSTSRKFRFLNLHNRFFFPLQTSRTKTKSFCFS